MLVLNQGSTVNVRSHGTRRMGSPPVGPPGRQSTSEDCRGSQISRKVLASHPRIHPIEFLPVLLWRADHLRFLQSHRGVRVMA